MTTEEIIALVSLVAFLLIQVAVFGYYAGKMAGHIRSLADTDMDTKNLIHAVTNKVDKNHADYFDVFVTKDHCDSVQATWHVRIDSLLDKWDMQTKQNTKEHEAIIANSAVTHAQQKDMLECLHRLDKKIRERRATDGEQVWPSTKT